MTDDARPHRTRRRLLLGAGVVLVLLVAALGGYAWVLNSKLGDLDRVPIDSLQDRPDEDAGKDIDVLLLGSDMGKPSAGGGDSVAEDAGSGTWPAGKYRSDTMMVVHISADREDVSIVSIPRDTRTTIYDASGEPQGDAKINAAFSEHGPAGAISTVEHLVDVRMDHLAILDWAGFKDLSRAVGGVPVTVPEAFCDSKQDKCWEARDYNLKGDEALQYVRTRYGLAGGDFDRIHRQQNFLRSLMKEMIDTGDLFKPVELNRMLGALADNLTVDEDWTSGEIRSLALSLRGIRSSDVAFLTAPVASTPTLPDLGSVVELDREELAELFDAVRDDSVRDYVREHPEAVLPDASEVG